MPRVALGQFTATDQLDHNLGEIERLAGEAADKGASLLCLHELSNTIYFCFRNDDAFKLLAEPDDGPSVTRIREAARKSGIAIVFPFYERTADGHLYNTALVIDEHGEVAGKYRKMSIPQINRTMTAGETAGDERYYFEPGDLGFPVFEVGGLKIGILICYDRHFTEAARTIGLGGADILLVPTATYRPWIRKGWEAELIGHAIANGYYVGGVNRVGQEDGGAPNRSYFGSSIFIDPAGDVLQRAGDQVAEVIVQDIDPARVADLRDLWGFFRWRRPEHYGLLTQPVESTPALKTLKAAGR
jgi:beta-ureidopropionase